MAHLSHMLSEQGGFDFHGGDQAGNEHDNDDFDFVDATPPRKQFRSLFDSPGLDDENTTVSMMDVDIDVDEHTETRDFEGSAPVLDIDGDDDEF